MKTTMLKSLSMIGIALTMALSVAAQEQPKVKVNDNEVKYKSDDVKVKEEKNETKIKTDDAKVKLQRDENKYKSENLKIKENENERKIKAKGVRPMHPTSTQRTELRTGETQVRVQEHLTPLREETTSSSVPTPPVTGPVAIPKNAATVKAPATHRYASKAMPHKPVTARKTGRAPKYIVRTKVVRDTVVVPSPPERVVTTQTEYVHDTVLVSRVDTVVKTEVRNTSSGYQVPAGDFKKVKLKKDKDGEVRMKRKE